MLRFSGDRTQGLVVHHPFERREPDRLGLGRPGDRAEVALIRQRTKGLTNGANVRHLEDHVTHTVHGGAPGVGVDLGCLKQGDEASQVGHPFDSGAPHPRVGITARDVQEHIVRVVIIGQTANRIHADRRVLTLPGWLSAQLLQEFHQVREWTGFSRLCILGTEFGGDAVRRNAACPAPGHPDVATHILQILIIGS